ncbi:DUF333 domain-containing protein [Mycobacterium yunnanensis]
MALSGCSGGDGTMPPATSSVASAVSASPAPNATGSPTTAAASPSSTAGDGGGMGVPNPASVYCLGRGGSLEITTGDPAGEIGLCHLPDGRVVEEWELYRTQE